MLGVVITACVIFLFLQFNFGCGKALRMCYHYQRSLFLFFMELGCKLLSSPKINLKPDFLKGSIVLRNMPPTPKSKPCGEFLRILKVWCRGFCAVLA
jgi:hypothetical protein